MIAREVFENRTVFLNMLRWLVDDDEVKVGGVNIRCPSFAFISSMAFSIVGYVENTIRALGRPY